MFELQGPREACVGLQVMILSTEGGDRTGKLPKPPLKGTNSLEAGPVLGRKE